MWILLVIGIRFCIASNFYKTHHNDVVYDEENLISKLLQNEREIFWCRLVSGVLQLPKGTHLILDETAMTDGQLSARGVQNLTSLGALKTVYKEPNKLDNNKLACAMFSTYGTYRSQSRTGIIVFFKLQKKTI
jgi:hypothetical protein